MAISNTDAEPEVLTEAERAELLVLYQVNAQDLANFKDQQWTLTNYILVAFAAFIGVPRIPGIEVSICGRLVLCVIATVVALLASWLIWRLKLPSKTAGSETNEFFLGLLLLFGRREVKRLSSALPRCTSSWCFSSLSD